MTSFDEVLCTYEVHHIAQYISDRLGDCGCVHVWSGKGLWACTCVECQGIVGVFMCGVARDCGCVHVWSGKGLWVSVERELKRLFAR